MNRKPLVRADVAFLLCALIIVAAILVLSSCGTTTDAPPTSRSTVTATVTTSVPTTIASRIPEAWDTTTLTVHPTSTPTPPEDVDRSTTDAADDTAPTAPTRVDGSAHAVVESITDGDTIRVQLDGESRPVRIIGVDTPETVDPSKPVQCQGPEAATRTAQLLTGGVVILTADPSQGDVDRYGRLLRYLDLDDGTDVGATLIREGLAREYTYDEPYQRQTAYIGAQDLAKTGGRGIWGNC